ncbi:MAG: hypothetical protein HYX76_08075 [Acidobacteria bacterium]|nr:hypothetical protein [Acidobacteriota bacterium]
MRLSDTTVSLVIVALALGVMVPQHAVMAQERQSQSVPTFKIDPAWPKPLPNNWVVGQIAGVTVDSHDRIWVLQRPRTLTVFEKAAAETPPTNECCAPAPPVLEFDQQGNLLRRWGGPGAGYEWPESEHGIFVDSHDNVWVGGNGRKDAQVLKFTSDGKFLMQIGHSGQSKGSNDTENLGRPAELFVDTPANELYVADGYGNRRVIVFDTETGKYKRHWGAYGRKPDDANPATGFFSQEAPPEQQFRTPVHCVIVAKDGLVYVCDRENNRLQLFKKDGTFVKEAILGKSLREGVTCNAAVSTDPQQRFLYIVDAGNNKVHILLRQSLENVGSFGGGGHNAGQFTTPHAMGVDSKGNLYVGEVTEGKRVQKFITK